MKFQVGDRVLVLHSNEEGEIIDILNDKMVIVDVRGVKFPAYADQLDFPYFRRFTEKKLFNRAEKKYIDDIRKEKQPPHKKVDGVWLSFLPVVDTDEFGDDVVEELKIHLVNHTYLSYRFYYRLIFFGHSEFELKNEIHPFGDFYIHNIPFGEMSDSPAFTFSFSPVQPRSELAESLEAVIKLKPRQLFGKLEEMRRRGEATFSYRLFEEYPPRPPEDKDLRLPPPRKGKLYDAAEARKHLPPARTVVDLHIEKLVEDWHRLTNAEILNLQLREFDKWYELAVIHRQPQMIVVHGLGSGRLRDEIHDILRLKKEVKSFVNQYHPSFGYGATEIYFQY